MERQTPRVRRFGVSAEKKFSTGLSQEPEVGVKWHTQRGWRVSQASRNRTLYVLNPMSAAVH